jgi:ABC-type lipoprotein release transport system permease subunit
VRSAISRSLDKKGYRVVQGLRVVGLACVVGLALSLALNRALSGMLFGVSPSDPVTLATVILIVISVSACACSLPATRAALVDPMTVLRGE